MRVPETVDQFLTKGCQVRVGFPEKGKQGNTVKRVLPTLVNRTVGVLLAMTDGGDFGATGERELGLHNG